MKKIFILFTIGFLLVSLGNIIYNSFPSKKYYKSGELKEIWDYVNPYFITYDLLRKIYGGSIFEFGNYNGIYSTCYYKNGNIKSKGITKGGRERGEWEYYYENGQLVMERNYTKALSKNYTGLFGEVLSQRCWDRNGNKIECSFELWVYIQTEQMKKE